MEKKNENKVILKQWVQLFLIIIVLLLTGLSIWAIVSNLGYEEAKGEEIYSYDYNSNISYKVYLKPNQFYTAPFMGMNKQYITSLIDHIDVTAKYNLQSTKEIEYTYTYEMIATAKGIFAESDGKATEIWSKVYPLSPSETKTDKGKDINIEKTVSIDYNKYDRVMKDFRDAFGLSVDARVDVTLKVNVSAGIVGEEKTLQESNVMNLQIPLLKSTIQLKPDYVNNGKQTIYAKGEVDNGINIPMLIIGVVGLLICLYLLKICASRLLTATKKSEYVLQLNKIFKEYADIIVESNNLPDLSKYDIISIKNFNDLVDIEEEVHSPIICNEIREDLETWFIISHDKTAYRFILKYEDFGRIINDKK